MSELVIKTALENGDLDKSFFKDNKMKGNKMEKIYLGKCGVDSGQLMITDPCYVYSFKDDEYRDVRRYKHTASGEVLQYGKDFGHYDEIILDYNKSMNELIENNIFVSLRHPESDSQEYSYQGACMITQSEKRGGEMINEHGAKVGVVFSSGYGDGVYPVYAIKNEDDRIVSVIIEMNEDEKHKEIFNELLKKGGS